MKYKKNILSDIVDYKKGIIRHLYDSFGLDYIKNKAMEDHHDNQSFMFSSELEKNGLSLIAEIKKASPSKGIINHDFKPKQLAADYVSCGATALSVLTDEKFFQGSNDVLSSVRDTISTPILRKDFTLDPIQVYEAAVLKANAILIILAILTVDEAQVLLDAAYECGLDVVVEIHNQDDVTKLYALQGIKIIGINNRDLNDFSVDIERSNVLYNQLKPDFSSSLFVAESGYSNAQECLKISDIGFNAVLIGEGLLISSDLKEFFSL